MLTKEQQLQQSISASLKHISLDEAMTQLEPDIHFDGENYIHTNAHELINSNKESLVRDYFTIHGYIVD